MTAPPPAGGTTSTRERLLQAAREVVDKEGLEGLSLRAIARHAGVSHGAPLRHFPTLASLLAAVAAQGFDRLVATVDEALAAAGAGAARTGVPLRAVDRLAIAGQGYIDVAVADPGVFSVTFRPERCDVTDPVYQAAGDRSFGQLVSLVKDAQGEGWHPDQPTRTVAAVVWAQVHGISELLIHGALLHVVGAGQLSSVQTVSRRLLFGVLGPSDALDALDALPGGPSAGPSEGGSP